MILELSIRYFIYSNKLYLQNLLMKIVYFRLCAMYLEYIDRKYETLRYEICYATKEVIIV